MKNKDIRRFRTIGEFHRYRNLPRPEHPLISVIDAGDLNEAYDPITLVTGYYSIALKRNFEGWFGYGQQDYDFDSGLMVFTAPGQVYSIEHTQDEVIKMEGWILLIHPDFLWNSSLANGIKKYDYFDYSVNEALFLSDKEETVINGIILNIQQEYRNNIDNFSQAIIISQLETLLNYAERFYQRQFITRKITHHKVLDHLEKLLTDHFAGDDLMDRGLPTVHQLSEELNLSSSYLNGLLKGLTGQSTQQHIHNKLIAKAKEKLSTTELSISEIAYQLGFEHPQSFSRLFKGKTKVSPSSFRNSFN